MKLFQKYTLGLLFFAALFMTACNDDDPVEIDPTLELTAGTEYDGAQLQGGDTIELSLNAIAGTHDLSTLIFYEDGVELPDWQDRLFINGDPAASDVLGLQGNDVDGFTMDVDILANTTNGEHDLVIEVTDAEENTDEVSLTYTTTEFNIDTLMGVLFNQGGPAGTGGLDLDEGIGTGTVDPSDSIAEIQDLGIDLGEPDTSNWKQMIAPYDDATMAYVGNTEFDFSSVTTETEIIAAFNDGNIIQESDIVVEGDVFAVSDNNKYYLILITEVVIRDGPDDNSDHYLIDIKKTR